MRIVTITRKPLAGASVAENVLRWGTGAIDIDGSRVGGGDILGSVNAVRRKDYPQSYEREGPGWGRTREDVLEIRCGGSRSPEDGRPTSCSSTIHPACPSARHRSERTGTTRPRDPPVPTLRGRQDMPVRPGSRSTTWTAKS
jgi:hypothetical protein